AAPWQRLPTSHRAQASLKPGSNEPGSFWALLRSQLLVTIEGRKRLSIITTLECERFGRRAVDGNGLSRLQANANATGRFGCHVIGIPEHCLNIALTVAGTEEGDDILIAYGGENGFESHNWPQFVHSFISVDRGGKSGEGDDRAGRRHLQRVAREREHRGISFFPSQTRV